MRIEIIQMLNEIIEVMNSNQKKIARNASINKNFEFFISVVNGEKVLFFKDLRTSELYNFVTFVKKSCNCD
jgi:hypothetical protein